MILYGKEVATQLFSHQVQDNISIGEYNYEVFLNFENNKLDKVTLRLVSGDAYSSYLFLGNELQKKYGSPSLGPREKKMSAGKIMDTEWVTEDTLIQLSYALFVFQGTTQTNLIKYSSRQSASSGKL